MKFCRQLGELKKLGVFCDNFFSAEKLSHGRFTKKKDGDLCLTKLSYELCRIGRQSEAKGHNTDTYSQFIFLLNRQKTLSQTIYFG